YVPDHFINTIAVDGDRLWLGTSEGLHIMHVTTGRLNTLAYNSRQIHGLTASHIRYVYIDNQGIYWIGTAGGGMNKYDKNLNLFNLVRSNVFDSKGLNVPIINAFAEDRSGKVFVGTEGGGLSVFDPVSRLFERVPLKRSNDYMAILALEYNQQKELVVGTYAEGLFMMDPTTKKYRQLTKGKGLHDLN